MKLKILITNQNKEVIYQGNPLNLPIRYKDIQRKSVELFDDEEPCIIHQSYAIQKLVDGFLKEFKGVEINEISFKNLDANYDFIEIENMNELFLTIKR